MTTSRVMMFSVQTLNLMVIENIRLPSIAPCSGSSKTLWPITSSVPRRRPRHQAFHQIGWEEPSQEMSRLHLQLNTVICLMEKQVVIEEPHYLHLWTGPAPGNRGRPPSYLKSASGPTSADSPSSQEIEGSGDLILIWQYFI